MPNNQQGSIPPTMGIENHVHEGKTSISGLEPNQTLLLGSAAPSRRTPLKLVLVNKATEKAKDTQAATTPTPKTRKPDSPTRSATVNRIQSKTRPRVIESDETEDELARDSIYKIKRVRRSNANARKSDVSRSSSRAPASSPGVLRAPVPVITISPVNEDIRIPGSLSESSHTGMLAAAQPMQMPPFCCVSVLAVRENALWSCDNYTCLQRHAIIMLSEELKAFNCSVPKATTRLLHEAKYMIQVIKYIPSAAAQIAILSNARPRATTVANKKIEWEIDTAGGSNGRFFIEALNENGIAAEKLNKDDSIWAEVDGMGSGNIKNRRWKRMDKSEMEYKCIEHSEEKWVCVYWKAVM